LFKFSLLAWYHKICLFMADPCSSFAARSEHFPYSQTSYQQVDLSAACSAQHSGGEFSRSHSVLGASAYGYQQPILRNSGLVVRR